MTLEAAYPLSQLSPVATVIDAFTVLLGALRVAFFVLGIVFALVALADWLARTRRLSPFSPVARFLRRRVDPLFVPIERRVLRSGGHPSAAPWWALAAVVIAGIVILSLLGFVRGQLVNAMLAVESGPSGIVRILLLWTFELLSLALIVRVISTWIGGSHSRWVRWTWPLTEPLLRPLRAVIPTIGMIDITPIVAFFLLRLVESFILRLV